MPFIPENTPKYPTTWTPETDEAGGTTFVPEGGFFSKVAESFERGQEGTLADIAVYHALTEKPEDLEGALRVRSKLSRQEYLNPIEGNWLSDIAYASSRTAAQMWEATKSAGKWGLVGAGIGGGIGLAAGLVAGGPTGEEPVTMGAGAKVGAKLFAAEAAALFSYRQGVGSMYANLIEQGTDPELANTVAGVAGIPYALLEVAQLAHLAPGVKKVAAETLQKTTQKILGKAIKKYGKTLTKEILEELGQEIVEIGAEDVSKVLGKQGIVVDSEYLKERGLRLLNVAKESAKGFALLPAPGVAIETAITVESVNMAKEIEQYKATAEGKAELNSITPEDVKSPIMKVSLALKDSIKTYESQEQIRKAEKAKRFGEAQNMRQEVEDNNWIKRAKSELKGAYTKLGIEPLVNKLPVETLNSMLQEIRTSDKLNVLEAINLTDAMTKMFKEGVVPRKFERNLAEKVWGKNFASILEAVEDKIKLGDKVTVSDYLALPKATAASMDISRTGRQNVLLIGSPKAFFQGLVRDWHLFLKDENTARSMEKSFLLKLEKVGDLLNKSGIRWNDWGTGVGFKTGSERFASRIAGKIPGIKRSERAYSMGGNAIRASKLLEIAKSRKGIPTTDEQWRHIGHVLNILTGEGDPKTFKKYLPLMNAIFFAPRLMEARIRAFVDLANLKHWTDPEWRPAMKILAYHVASFMAVNLGILGLMATVPGVDVEKDPRSSDFGKIRMGDTRIDFWGGYLPLMRLCVHLATRQRKTRAGKIVEQEWMDTITRFLQSKLGPVPGYVLDLMKGETFYGDYVGLEANSLTEQFYHRFTPFFIQDVMDALKYQGIGTGMVAAPLAFHGVGVQTYPMTPGTQTNLRKNELSMNVLGRKWDDLGPEVQSLMKENFPEIEMMERKSSFDNSNFSFIEKIEKERQATVNRIYKGLPPDIRKEFDILNIRPSGINRKISNDWYLNDKRFKEYENNVTKVYRLIFSDLMRSSDWDKASPDMKTALLKEIMDEVKASVRQQIVLKANLDDLEQIQRRF